MLVIQFLILGCTFIMTSGLDVLNYPEFIKHLENLEQNGYPIDHEKRVDTSDDDNQKSLYEVIRRFEMKITNLIKRSFSTSKIRNRKERRKVEGDDLDHYISLGLSF